MIAVDPEKGNLLRPAARRLLRFEMNQPQVLGDAGSKQILVERNAIVGSMLASAACDEWQIRIDCINAHTMTSLGAVSQRDGRSSGTRADFHDAAVACL